MGSIKNQGTILDVRTDGNQITVRLDKNFLMNSEYEGLPVVSLELTPDDSYTHIVDFFDVGKQLYYESLKRTKKKTSLFIDVGDYEEEIVCTQVAEALSDYTAEDWRIKCNFIAERLLMNARRAEFYEMLYRSLKGGLAEELGDEIDHCQKDAALHSQSNQEKEVLLIAQAKAYQRVLDKIGWVKGQPLESAIKKWLHSLVMRDWEDESHPDPVGHRQSLVKEIVGAGELAVFPLMELLVHHDWAVRKDAALMLGRIGNARASELLKWLAYGDESENVRQHAASAATRLGVPGRLFKDERSAKDRVSQALSEWATHGETDSEIMNRVIAIAKKRGVITNDIITAWMLYQGIANPPQDTLDGTIRLSLEECAFLEEVYRVDRC